MKKFYSLFVLLILSVLGITANAENQAKVTISGQFYTFSAQDSENPRNEAFSFGNSNYVDVEKTFTFDPEVTYELKGQNEANQYFVYINGVRVNNDYAADEQGFFTTVKFNDGDEVEIYENTPYTGNVTIDGQFYTFVAQNPDNTRDEAINFGNETYANQTQAFTFSPAITYTFKGYNGKNQFFVYVNGVQIPNTLDADQTGFEATVKFNAGDKVEIYENTPYTGNVTIDGQFYTFVAQNPDNTRDEAINFGNETYANQTQAFTFSPAITYTLKGYNMENQFFVYVNGVQLPNQAGEGETGYTATVKFNAGDKVEIYEATPYVANVTVNGQFYTFVAQNADNTRDEAFDIKNNTYDNESVDFNFSPAVTYTLKGYNEKNQFFVYVNGVQLPNQAGEGETGYTATVKFAAGDKVEIFEATPYVANVTVNGQFYTFVAQNPDNTRDEAFDFTNNTYDNESAEFNFSPAITYTLKGQNQANSFFVYVNGVLLPNTVGADQTGYEATVKFAAGDKVEIYEATPYVANVTINGQFYTFVAQNPDNTRDEAFDFTNNTYDNESVDFNFSPAVVYTLKGQNQSNNFFVYVNGVQVLNTLDADQTGYEATVKFAAGDKVEICEASPYVATVLVDGQFYTLTAQNQDNTRDEAFAFTYNTYDNVTEEFVFNPNVTYTIKAQNASDTFFVYVNGVQLPNTVGADQTGYEANVKFAAGDKVEIYETTPYVANVTINGAFYTFVAQNADNTRDEAFTFGYNTYDNESADFNFSPGVVYTLKGQNEANTFFVYVNGVLVPNTVDADQTGYEANVQFAAGDKVEICVATPYVANVTINGQFYTFVAQNPDNTRDEAFDFTNNTYNNESADFYFSPAVTYTLKGQNEANNFFVYVNGVQLPNLAGEGETGYVAEIQFNAGDKVEIYEATPYVATVTIDGSFYTFVAQNPDNTRDEAFDFTYNTYAAQTETFTFSPAVTYALKGQNEANTFFVYVNDERIANEAGEGETGFIANIKFNAGDVVKIYATDPASGINGIIVDEINGKVFNLQGVEMKNGNLAPGLYIVNGKKQYIR